MKVIIEDDYLAQLANEYPDTYGKRRYPHEVERKFIIRVNEIASAGSENDLRNKKSLHFEKLRGEYNGRYSIRINKAWRLIFRINQDGYAKVLFIEELNNHYGD